MISLILLRYCNISTKIEKNRICWNRLIFEKGRDRVLTGESLLSMRAFHWSLRTTAGKFFRGKKEKTVLF